MKKPRSRKSRETVSLTGVINFLQNSEYVDTYFAVKTFLLNSEVRLRRATVPVYMQDVLTWIFNYV
jgi:hypothetical protein